VEPLERNQQLRTGKRKGGRTERGKGTVTTGGTLRKRLEVTYELRAAQEQGALKDTGVLGTNPTSCPRGVSRWVFAEKKKGNGSRRTKRGRKNTKTGIPLVRSHVGENQVKKKLQRSEGGGVHRTQKKKSGLQEGMST